MPDFLTDLFRTLIPEASPNSWQRRLYQSMLNHGRLPGAIRVPTSGGKTAILMVYLAALATQVQQGRVTLPRRIVMVINRRALVDQATSLAEAINTALEVGDLPISVKHLRRSPPAGDRWRFPRYGVSTPTTANGRSIPAHPPSF